MTPWPFLSLSANLKTEAVTSLNDLNHLNIGFTMSEKGTFERKNKNTPGVVAWLPSISGPLLFLFSKFVDKEPPASLSPSMSNEELEEPATGSTEPDTTTPVSAICSAIANDLRDEFERELPADLNPDLANDAALDRGGRGLVVDGAGRSSEISLSPGGIFERILLDLRIDIVWRLAAQFCERSRGRVT